MQDKTRKPRAPLSPAKRAGKIAEYTVERDQAIKDCKAHFSEGDRPDLCLTELHGISNAAQLSLRQAFAAQRKLDKLEAEPK